MPVYTEMKSKLLSRVQLFATTWTIQSIEFSRPEYWSGYPFPSPGKLPNPGIKPRSPALRADSLPAEPQWKPKDTGVGSLSLLQRIFPAQEANRGLLHCRQILYQLSYEGTPHRHWWSPKPGVLLTITGGAQYSVSKTLQLSGRITLL